MLRLLDQLNGGSTGPRRSRCLELYRVLLRLLLLLLQLRLLGALGDDGPRLSLLAGCLGLVGLNGLHELGLLAGPLDEGETLGQHGLRHVVAATDRPDDCHRLRGGLDLLGLLLATLLGDVGDESGDR